MRLGLRSLSLLTLFLILRREDNDGEDSAEEVFPATVN